MEPYTSPVGSFAPNGYGLCDMAGNVYDWCWDWHEENYPSAPQSDPHGPASGTFRMCRGGCWSADAGLASYGRAAFRAPYNATSTRNFIGFRIVRSSAP